MSERIRIRARHGNGRTDVVVLMPHPMETGLRKDATGVPVSAHFITEVVVALGTRRVFGALLSNAVSQDPLLSFSFLGGSPGERLSVSWTDNRGESRGDEVVIS